MKFDPAERMEKLFEGETKARGTKYAVSEAIGPYSRLCMAVGLISFFLPGPSSDIVTKTDLRTTITQVMKAMEEDRNMATESSQELLIQIMEEYEALNVSSPCA